MVVRSLETRGLHEEARKYLQPFIEGQGKKVFPGNFKSSEGVFHAAYPYPDNDPYTALGYNMNHGWVLWGLCEHYFWTRDNADIMAILPNIISACDWIIKERQATKVLNPDGTKPIEWGLAPAGQLEDVEEFLYFYSTNAYYYAGLKTAAEVLRDIGHSEAERIGLEAKEYKKDILESIRRATAETPVVRLLDGSYIPYVPHRAYVTTHLKEGWIREGLYSSLHLLDAGIFKPNDIAVTWLLQNLEDNIFVSRESGYGIEDLESNFFDLGGFTKQPCLLSNSTAHLLRDEIPNQLRVLWNTFAASYYRDAKCFAEWVRHLGEGGGPLYKTPDEAKFCNYLRNMLVYEDGSTLRLGMGVPRNWMDDGKSIQIKRAATFFGQMDMSIKSHISQGFIKAEISLPSRNRPNKILH